MEKEIKEVKETKVIVEKDQRKIKKFFKKGVDFISEHFDSVITIAASMASIGVAILGYVTVKTDHKLTKEEKDIDTELYYYQHGWIEDPENHISWFAPMNADERKQMLDREKNGESRRSILEDMGKI